jgi:LPPG:FO 2-phospho-L-lactate transferase
LGDRDLATHFFRTQQLAQGKTLTQVTAQLCDALHIAPHVLPMCDEALPTLLETDAGTLAFQHYFVREQCQPVVQRIQHAAAQHSTLSPEVRSALQDPAVQQIVICPSNPWLSIAPILAVSGMREILQTQREKIVVVSPLVGGQAVKGPTAKIMQEMNIPLTSHSIAQFYRDLLGALIIDERDAHEANALREQGIAVNICNTLMKTDGDKIALAEAMLYCGHTSQQKTAL